jgi:hypothetical protein
MFPHLGHPDNHLITTPAPCKLASRSRYWPDPYRPAGFISPGQVETRRLHQTA